VPGVRLAYGIYGGVSVYIFLSAFSTEFTGGVSVLRIWQRYIYSYPPFLWNRLFYGIYREGLGLAYGYGNNLASPSCRLWRVLNDTRALGKFVNWF